jgi:transposase
MLNQSEKDCTITQMELSQQLFAHYPDLETAYRLSENFKEWDSPRNKTKNRRTLEKELFEWYDQVEKSNLNEFKAVVKMIEKHEEEIVNYFLNTQTNAKAENMNGKIQRFITNNYGIRDIDFTLYRIAHYFS